MPVYVSLDGSQFSLDPAGIARAGRLLEQKVRTDGGGKFVQPPVSDDQIGEVLSSILA